jgi:type II secretory pathway component PulJ
VARIMVIILYMVSTMKLTRRLQCAFALVEVMVACGLLAIAAAASVMFLNSMVPCRTRLCACQ